MKARITIEKRGSDETTRTDTGMGRNETETGI
jgi:hypothetical protein